MKDKWHGLFDKIEVLKCAHSITTWRSCQKHTADLNARGTPHAGIHQNGIAHVVTSAPETRLGLPKRSVTFVRS
jgi:hypothetical protein